MRKAKLSVMCVSVTCPHCKEDVVNSSGSYLWEIAFISPSQVFICSECGKEFMIPKNVSENKV